MHPQDLPNPTSSPLASMMRLERLPPPAARRFPMRTMRVDDDDEDPYNLCVPRELTPPTTLYCFGQRILYEGWAIKQSHWLKQWRRRWMALTSKHILFFKSFQGYAFGEEPTERFEVASLPCGAAKVLTEEERKEVDLPNAASRALMHLSTAKRDVLLDLTPEAASPKEILKEATTLMLELGRCTTAIVNARCAIKLGAHLPCYGLEGCAHAFEPRGAVAFRERVLLGDERGRGAFGVVYQGRCLQSGRRLAIKQVKLHSHQHREKIWQEVEIMRRVQHPHVVAILNFHETWSHAHIVMELLPGGDLYTQVIQRYWNAERDGYAEREVREILRMALSGLEALHSHSVVHRDLKPENLLLMDRRGTGLVDLRIADFGAAHILQPSEVVTQRAGTPGHMAPEILSGQAYGLPVDLWSLGVILFTLLSGRPPFDGRDEAKEEKDIIAGRWSMSHDPNWNVVSEEAKGVVKALLATDPKHRPRVDEALQLPWMRPMYTHGQPTDGFVPQNNRFGDKTESAAASSPSGTSQQLSKGRNASDMMRVGSLPGSASLLELKGLSSEDLKQVAPPQRMHGRTGWSREKLDQTSTTGSKEDLIGP